MKTEYKYIKFQQVFNRGKTQIWICLNKRSGGRLATIKWYGAWRQYCFYPEGYTVFNKTCLEDVNNFIDQLKLSRKNNENIQLP